MRKIQIENAAMEVATQVRAVEETIDQAIIEIAELQARLVRARAVAGIGIRTGHEAFEQLAATVGALVAARGGIGNCHGALVEAKSFVPGLRTVSFGDHECPPEEARADLRIVA